MTGIDGSSLLPTTNENLRPLLGRRVRFLVGDKVIWRTVMRDDRVPSIERYIARARTHGQVITSDWLIVG